MALPETPAAHPLMGCGRSELQLAIAKTTTAGILLALWSVGLVACGGDGGGETSTAGAVPADPRQLIGTMPPPLSGSNITGDGDTGIERFAGKPMAIVFWVNTCPTCQATMPHVDALQAKLGSAAQIFSVAIHDPVADGEGDPGFETPTAAASTMNLHIPTIVQERARADSDWRLAHLPTAFVLNAGHTIVDVVQTDASGLDITGLVERALGNAAG